MRRKNRLLALGIVVILAILFGIEFLLLKSEKVSPSFIANSFVVWALWNLCLLLIMILLFMLLRNVVKLSLERRRNIPGARFKSRLVVFFISLSLLPTLLLFFFGSDIIQRTLEGWFRLPVSTMVGDSQAVADRYYKDVTERAFFLAQMVGRRVGEARLFSEERGMIVQERLESWLKEYRLDIIALYDGEDLALVTVNSRIPVEQIAEVPIEQVRKCLQGEVWRQIDPMMQGELVRSMIPYFEPPSPTPSGCVVAGFYLDDSVSTRLKRIVGTAQQYSQTYALRSPIKTTYFLVFLFVTLLILFAATWSGLHLAREITVPIEHLGTATREVAAGNLNYRVQWKSSDEFGSLVDSFNRMTEDLRVSNEKLRLSKIHLEETNIEIERRGRLIEMVLQNIAAGVISVGADGQVQAANAAALKLLGLQGITPGGMDCRELLRATPELAAVVEESLRERSPLEEREVIVHAGGRSLTLAVNTTFLEESGTGSQMLVVLNDLTQLIRAQRMETWKEVARRIAHEIKNPLTPIQLSAQRIRKNFLKQTPHLAQVIEEGTSTIEREVATMKNMVNEFTSFARMPGVRLAPGDLNQLVQKTLAMYDGLFADVRFVQNLGDIPAPVAFDPEQLKRALINVIDNAIEAMDRRGTLTIRTSCAPGATSCQIEITDTGPGVPPEDREKVFLPYFSTKKRGSGLGLAIVNQIIADHDGSIRVEDNVPSGTRFVVELPVEVRRRSTDRPVA